MASPQPELSSYQVKGGRRYLNGRSLEKAFSLGCCDFITCCSALFPQSLAQLCELWQNLSKNLPLQFSSLKLVTFKVGDLAGNPAAWNVDMLTCFVYFYL